MDDFGLLLINAALLPRGSADEFLRSRTGDTPAGRLACIAELRGRQIPGAHIRFGNPDWSPEPRALAKSLADSKHLCNFEGPSGRRRSGEAAIAAGASGMAASHTVLQRDGVFGA